jgi:hypothetical protein
MAPIPPNARTAAAQPWRSSIPDDPILAVTVPIGRGTA